MLTRQQYQKGQFPDREFMRPVGEISFHFLSRAPQPTQSYLTIISPCDKYVWILLASSIVTITLTLLVVDFSFAKMTGTLTKGLIHQSVQDAPIELKAVIIYLILQVSSLALGQSWMKLYWINISTSHPVQRPGRLLCVCGSFWGFSSQLAINLCSFRT